MQVAWWLLLVLGTLSFGDFGFWEMIVTVMDCASRGEIAERGIMIESTRSLFRDS